MKIERVTILGIDDSIEIDHLVKISEYYPFVEWGIILDRGRELPSRTYLGNLFDNRDKLRIVGILRGEWLEDFKKGNISIKRSRKFIWDMIKRLQIDPRGGDSELVLRAISLLKMQVILETDFIREIHLDAISRGLNIEILFNKVYSGIWQHPMDEVSCSYYRPFGEDIETDLANMNVSIGDRQIAIQIEYGEDLEEKLSLIEEYVSEPSRSSGFFETRSAI
jgi:hypothetical protein